MRDLTTPAVGTIRIRWAMAALAALCVPLLAEPACAESARGLIQQGNAQFRAGQFADALKTYEGAFAADPKSLEARFNRGVAAYRAGDADLAQRTFREVDSAGGNPDLAAAARFNLGVIATQQLREKPPEQPEQALDALKNAASLFRGSLDLAPADADAARNLELTRLAIRDLQKQIEEMKKLQQQMKDLQEQLKQNQKEQQEAAQQNQQRSSDPQPDDQQKQESGAEQKPVSEQTKDAQQKLEDLKEKMGQDQPQAVKAPQLTDEKPEDQKEDQKEDGASSEPPPQSPQQRMEEASKSLDQAREHQQKAEQEIQQGDLKDAQKEQQHAADQLKKALEQLTPPKDQEHQDQEGEQQPQDPQQQPESQEQQDQEQPPPEQQGEQMDQAEGESEPATDTRLGRILEKERRDREYKKEILRRIRARNRPVEKDW